MLWISKNYLNKRANSRNIALFGASRRRCVIRYVIKERSMEYFLVKNHVRAQLGNASKSRNLHTRRIFINFWKFTKILGCRLSSVRMPHDLKTNLADSPTLRSVEHYSFQIHWLIIWFSFAAGATYRMLPRKGLNKESTSHSWPATSN